MLNTVLTLELVLFSVVGMAALPYLFKYWRSLERREKLLALAWSALIVGQHQLFVHEIRGAVTIDTGATYQLTWMFIAGLIALPAFLSAKISSNVWKLPVVAFTAYIFFAFGSAAFSASPPFTIYRALQLSLDLALVLVAYSALKKTGRPDHLVKVSIFWLLLLLFSVIAGAVVSPERAFESSAGALGVTLRGVVPVIHQNELGLMAAFGIVIGMVRGLGGAAKGRLRLFWFAVALISVTILFLTQARTSLGAALVSLLAVGFMVRRLRWLAYVMVGLGAFIAAYYLLSDAGLGIEEQIETYARRGSTDEQIESLSGRIGLWQVGWEMFGDSPVLGHGFQTGVRSKGIQYGLPLGTNMHSAHMQVLVDTGALGYLAWIVFILGMAATVYKNYRRVNKADVIAQMAAVENILIVFVILFRSVLGHVLVSHQLNMMIFLSIYLYSALHLEASRHGRRIADPKTGNETEKHKANPRARGALSARIPS